MDKKQKSKQLMALFLSILMIVGILPLNIFAETYKEIENGKEVEKTTDWSEAGRKKDDEEKGSWALSPNNRLVQVSPSDPVKTPDINYEGTYTNTEGREVVRFTFSAKVASDNQWDKLVVKLPKELDDIADHQHPFRGIVKGTSGPYGYHDRAEADHIGEPYTDYRAVPDALNWSVGGGKNTYAFDLYKNGSMKPGAQLLPIDVVLQEGKSIKNINKDLVIQARLMDKNFARVYMRAGEKSKDYLQYTMTTVIPHEKNYQVYLTKDLSALIPSSPMLEPTNKFFATVSSTKFDIANGYLEVYYRQFKGDTRKGYALRQVVESSFFDLLEERNGMVGEVYLLGADANVYIGFGDRKTGEPNDAHKIQFRRSDIQDSADGKVGFLQIAGNEWDSTIENQDGIVTKKSSNVGTTKAILGTANTDGNGGIYTVVRYFINKEALIKLIKDNGLKSYVFRTSILRENKDHRYGGPAFPKTDSYSDYKFQLDNDIDLKRGTKVKFKYDQAQYGKVGTYTAVRPQIKVGSENYNITFASSAELDGTGTELTWTVPFDIRLKAGEEFKLTSLDWKKRATTASVDFGNGEVLYANAVHNKQPVEMNRSASLTGAVLTSTLEKPNVDEIFTDSTNITGHSYFDGAEVNIYHFDETGKEVKQTISAVGATKDSDDYDYSQILTKAKYVNGEEYDAFGFDTTKPNQGGVIQGNKKFDDFKMPKLERDMPIRVDNLDTLSSFIDSKDVVEQVQTKFHFDLNGQTSKKNKEVIDKIAPLSKEYKFDPETGVENTNYVPSGFEGDNVKYGKETTKVVDGKTYQNVLDHDGLEYDLQKPDQKEAFLMRQMPTKDEINVPQGKRILGWTTTKLTDTAEKTAIEQFNELKDNNKVVKNVEDWAKVDANETYIFDANSPIDKERTVYAVYGDGINIVLHSNNTDNLNDETTITIPVTVSDIDNTNDIIDAVTSATLSNMKGNLVIKELPKVPVTGEDSEIAKITDAKAKLFNKPNNSFLGWTLYRYSNDPQTSQLIAGQNNERIGELINGVVANGTKRIPKRTEWIKDIKGDANKYTKYVPNTFSVALRAQDVPSQDDNKGTGVYKIFLDAIDEGKDLHLYANYRPFFDVKVYPSYKNIDKTADATHQYGKYEDTVEEAKKHSVNVGLLHRTAVTNYGTPTVHQNANYYPLQGGAASLKPWDGKSTDPLVWTLPGFDELGQRKSYVSVIVTDDKKDAYENFKSPDWDKLGAKTYIRLQDETATQDPNAPKNLHENAGNPYGDPVAKDQTFTVGVDAFTSATSRKALVTTGDNEEVIGYEIWNTSTPLEVLKPVFDNIYDDETEAKLHWTDAEKNADIKKIILTVADGAETTLIKQNDGTYTDGTITATPTGDKLVLSPLDLTGKAGQDIVAKYVVEKNGQEVTGPEGRITINERGTSAPVEEMKQIPNDADGKSKIEFKVPDPVLNKPTKGTVYTAQKWDETEGKWVDLGKVTLDSDDDKGTQKEITLDGDVKDGDIVRIKSEQPNLKPNDSTGTGDVNYTPQDGDENRKYVKIDKAGPQANVTAKDEEFRRFIDLEGTINEIPDGRKVKITIDYKDGNPVEMEKEITVENRQNIIKELNTVLRKGIEEGNIPEIKIVAVDKFGNSQESEVDYTESYQLKVLISGERAGKKFVKVSADKANATVNIKVMNNGKEVSSASATVTAPNTFVKVRFNNGYALKSGDELVISGTATENGKTYTSNPYERAVK
ncbi:MAG: hypothetical protein ACLUN8_03825 [Peptoniphilus grossensis]